jgi:hypothetical protein
LSKLIEFYGIHSDSLHIQRLKCGLRVWSFQDRMPNAKNNISAVKPFEMNEGKRA